MKKQVISINQWSQLMHGAYGENGQWAVLWVLASRYKKLFLKIADHFPHYLILGNQHTDAESISKSIGAFFNLDNRPFVLSANEDLSFMSRMTENLPVIRFSDFSTRIEASRIVILTHVNNQSTAPLSEDKFLLKESSPVVISSEESPANFPYSFCLSIIMRQSESKSGSISSSQLENLKKLHSAELRGFDFIEELSDYDYLVESLIENVYKFILNDLKSTGISSRASRTYVPLVCMNLILGKSLNLPFDLDTTNKMMHNAIQIDWQLMIDKSKK